MQEDQPASATWKSPLRHWTALVQDREEQVFLVLTLLIGALVGLPLSLSQSASARAFILPGEPPGGGS